MQSISQPNLCKTYAGMVYSASLGNAVFIFKYSRTNHALMNNSPAAYVCQVTI